MRTRERKRAANSGAALPIIMLLMVGIAVLSLNAGRLTSIQETLAGNTKRIHEAQRSAETGVEYVESGILSGALTIPGTLPQDYPTSGTTSYVARLDALKASSGDAYTAANGRPAYVVSSEGESGPAGRSAERRVEAALYFTYSDDGLWDYGLAGCDGVEFGGKTESDSYSSSGNPASGDMGDVGTLEPDADIDVATNSEINGDIRATGGLIMQNNAKACKHAEANGNMSLVGSAWVGSDANAGGNIVLDNKQTTDCAGNGLGTSHSVRGDANAYGDITINSGKIMGVATAAGTVSGGTGNSNTAPPIDNPPVPIAACDPLDIPTVMAQKKLDICTNGNNHNAELDAAAANFDAGTKIYDMDDNSGADHIGDVATGQPRQYCLKQFLMSKSGKVTIHGDVTLYIQDDSADFVFELASNDDLVLGSGASLTVFIDHMTAAEGASNAQNGRLKIKSNANVNHDRDTGATGIPANIRIFSDYASYVSPTTGKLDCAHLSSPTSYDGLEINANTVFAGVVYAPHACVELDSPAGTFYGALRGGFVETVSNVQFRYDEDLHGSGAGSGIGTGITGSHLLYWRED